MVGVNGIDFGAIIFIVIFIFNQRHGSQVDEDVAFGDVAVLYLRIYHAAVPQVLGGVALGGLFFCLFFYGFTNPLQGVVVLVAGGGFAVVGNS